MIVSHIDEKSIESLLTLAKDIDPKDEGKAVLKGFRAGALLIERALKWNVTGPYLNVRSGYLRASIGSKVEVVDGGLQATIGSGAGKGGRVRYADIQETGGTIRPVLSQYLTIPLDAAKTPSGVTRFSANDVRYGFTKYSGSFIRNHIIVGKSGKNRITPLFVLKTSVTIPASRYMSKTRDETTADANQAVLYGIREALLNRKKQ
jgi:hypothetical protein